MTEFARNTDPATSHAAAQSIDITYLEGKVLEGIQSFPGAGATQDDLVSKLGLASNTITPRFKTLLDKGVIYADGARKGVSGKAQRVHYPVPGIVVKAAASRDVIVREVEREQATIRAQREAEQLLARARALQNEFGFKINGA